jgi:hypothetical protein
MAKNKSVKRQKSKTTSILNATPPIEYNKHKPIFSFHNMKYQGDNCLSRCDQSSKCQVVDKLLELSQLTWGQIGSAPREGMGFENIPTGQFHIPLPNFVTPEVKNLQVFRYSARGRIAGLRLLDIYHILAIGPSLYPH